MGVGLTDVLLNQALAESLDPETLASWNRFAKIYMLGSLGAEGLEALAKWKLARMQANKSLEVTTKEEVEEVLRVTGVGSGNVTNIFFKNVDEFALTFDKAGTVSQTIRNQAFDLYKQGRWGELEALFINNNLNKSGTTIWPPANGGYNIVDNVELKAGMKFDRYGGATPGWNGQGVPPLGGNFTSPMMQSGGAYSFGQRALNQAENLYDFYYEIEILKDLPFKGQTADVIPWFGQIGGGKQTMWNIPKAGDYPKTWNMLAAEGYIKITIKSSPSGNFPNLVNTVIK